MKNNDEDGPTAGGMASGARAVTETTSEYDAVFRVITHHGQKHGLKLEGIFWKILQLAASADRKRIGPYVEAVLERHPEQTNMSSVIRVHTAEWLANRITEAAAKALSPRLVGRTVQALPMPCFTMDIDNRITSQNGLFMELLKRMIEEQALAPADAVRIHFKADMMALREMLAEAKRSFVDDEVHIQFRSSNMHRQARIISIDSGQGVSIGLLVLIMA